MGLFRKRNEIVDLTETVIPQRKITEKINSFNNSLKEKPTPVTDTNSVLDFISGESYNATVESDKKTLDLPDIQIMLKNATQRIDDHSHDLYKLLHRIELLEKKIERLESREQYNLE